MTVYIVRPGVCRKVPGPADLAEARRGDIIRLIGPSPEDAAPWAPALWFALSRGATVEVE